MLATVSHLPHVLANVLVAQAARALSEEGEQLPATGPSFRDITRVAGSNTAIWRDIYLANADALIAAIDDAGARLASVRAALASGDGDGDRRLERRRRRRPPAPAGGRAGRRRGLRAARLGPQPPGRRRRGRARARARRRSTSSTWRSTPRRTARRATSSCGSRARSGRRRPRRSSPSWGCRWRAHERDLPPGRGGPRHARPAARQVALAPRGAARRDERRAGPRHELPRRGRHALVARRRAGARRARRGRAATTAW